mmetsp:Transcript_18079/g.51007  ORF Transcript_18079/g.51007 Transcript_18079/m.51007 type:complete len:276 (-) Transcript_18079:38-865(-)
MTGSEGESHPRSSADGARRVCAEEDLEEVAVSFARKKLLCHMAGEKFVTGRFVMGMSVRLMNRNRELRRVGYEATRSMISQYLTTCRLAALSVEDIIQEPAVEPVLGKALRLYESFVTSRVTHASLIRQRLALLESSKPLSSLSVAALRARARTVVDRKKLRSWRAGKLTLSIGGVPWGPALVEGGGNAVAAGTAVPPPDDGDLPQWPRTFSHMARVHLLTLLENLESHEWTDVPADPSPLSPAFSVGAPNPNRKRKRSAASVPKPAKKGLGRQN